MHSLRPLTPPDLIVIVEFLSKQIFLSHSLYSSLTLWVSLSPSITVTVSYVVVSFLFRCKEIFCTLHSSFLFVLLIGSVLTIYFHSTIAKISHSIFFLCLFSLLFVFYFYFCNSQYFLLPTCGLIFSLRIFLNS